MQVKSIIAFQACACRIETKLCMMQLSLQCKAPSLIKGTDLEAVKAELNTLRYFIITGKASARQIDFYLKAKRILKRYCAFYVAYSLRTGEWQ